MLSFLFQHLSQGVDIKFGEIAFMDVFLNRKMEKIRNENHMFNKLTKEKLILKQRVCDKSIVHCITYNDCMPHERVKGNQNAN